MVRRSYLAPDHQTRMLLRRTWMDLRAETDRCRPFGPEYKRLAALLTQVGETYAALFGESVAQSGGGYWSRPPT